MMGLEHLVLLLLTILAYINGVRLKKYLSELEAQYPDQFNTLGSPTVWNWEYVKVQHGFGSFRYFFQKKYEEYGNEKLKDEANRIRRTMMLLVYILIPYGLYVFYGAIMQFKVYV